MLKRLTVVVFIAAGLLALLAGLVAVAGPGRAEAVPAFARQYDLQCNACHTRPPRLNRFGEQFHMMGFQIPSAAQPGGIVTNVREDGTVKTLIDSLALRVEGGLFEYSASPRETETKFAPPDEITLFVARPLLPELSIFIEIEGEPNAVAFENGRYFQRGQFGLGKEAFFMLNLGRLLGALGAPTMEMGGQTMVGTHGGFSMHGPMLMAGKVDPNTNFSYATNRQLIAPTELEVAHGKVERLPVVPYAFASKFFGLFKNRDEREPQLATDQVMYNTSGAPGADFHAMLNDVVLGQVGFLRENEGFNTYMAARFDLLDRGEFTFNVSALMNWGFGVVRAPDPEDHNQPGSNRLDRLRYGMAANVRWKQLDVYGAVIWDRLYGLPGELRGSFDRSATGLTIQVDYLVHEKVMLSSRFDQLWAGGLKDEKRDGSVLSLQAKFYPWQNIAFFVRDSVNLRSFVENSPLRNWRNQLFVGIDWGF
ncbi:MAG: hypothetical protein DME01_24830 [Candidatus Rokuibacteriota bacterium]|nr:MAG: hypothetical protein DME01_24830 [Candidatus Rokubacteria bacterium]